MGWPARLAQPRPISDPIAAERQLDVLEAGFAKASRI